MPRRLGTVLVLTLILAACEKKQAGSSCSPGQVACADAHTGLFCLAGKFATMSCLGPAGCQGVGQNDVACDNPVANAGDGCNQVGDTACTVDRKAALACTGQKFVVAQPCKGPRGCISAGDSVYCDNALAEAGDACVEEGDTACTTDRGALMKCEKGKFVVTNSCRGPKRCTVTEKPDENKEQFECDDSLTQIGDSCEDEGEESCSTDRKELHVCKAHLVALARPCPGPKGCSWTTASRFECDARKK